ncbi:MAG: type II and III secretion system protein family protein [Rhodobacter sp.]|uniref:type II and III secretion system protein family protein n=1 Tax=Pararhodobacter sp. TaxID=2127056 RepID=UPI001D3BFE14|nr:type II and III secretion system protein family protein [Pararhodobacter sp.]MCB1344577.1 type II and III secretion system protein family protein [Paracoccaceae bacterium]MCB1408233.1 type II and III secretion system protein family protein [Paracoccaceae bacterium]MCC0071914.1 type II and III secretion system protein family protein [Rhodobacter sp.]HPD91037.1 type II and III secretion system protein family protein [Pararhodobacter sp.]
MTVKSSFAPSLALALAGLATPLLMAGGAHAQTLRVASTSIRDTLSVAMNRAVVVDSDTPFVELSIANPGIADISTLSDRSIYVLGKAPGRTTLTILGANGELIANVEVQVTPDVAEFRERLRQILPSENIEVRTANDGIVMSGVVTSAARMDAALQLAERYAPGRVSNLMSVGGSQQVMLQVRFSEVQRTAAQNLAASLAVGGGGNVLGSGAFSTATAATAALGGSVSPSGADRQGVLSGGFTIGSVQFQVMLEALESNGLARTLSEPSLTALSGQEAHFLAGGEIPVPVVGSSGSVSIDYRSFGVELTFTPVVGNDSQINLTMDASVSSLDAANGVSTGGVTVPAFRRRQTSTTVELHDGESFAIAGLLQDDFQGNIDQVPWLGDLPVLGALFRSTNYQRNQSELMIFVTAHLVTPTRSDALILPTDRIRPPSERDLFLNGRMSGASGGAGEVARQDFRGGYGYVME